MQSLPERADSAGKPKVVLIAESDETFRQELSSILARHGYSTKEARTSQEAVQSLKAGHIDLVCSELDLPGAMGGDGLASWLRGNQPGVAILLSSRSRLPANDGISFIKRPFSEAEFIERVAALLAGSATSDQS